MLSNTVEQLVSAAITWPFAALVLGGFVAVSLGIGFAIARVAFWIGDHISPPMRSFGFAATFYPTVLVGSGLAYLTGARPA